MKRFLTLTVVLVATVLAASVVVADVPQMINYQGQLTDSTGAPLDTTVSMVFTIYDSPGAVVGIWYSGIQTVNVENGLFTYQLGSVNRLADDIFTDTLRWLGIKVGSDDEISPRTKLTSVPYAYHALRADTSGFANDIADGSVTNSKLAAASVTDDKLADGAVTNAKLANLAVTSGKIADQAVSTTKIADESITSIKITDGTIQFGDINQNGATSGQVMKWNGSAWAPAADDAGSASGWSDDGTVVRLDTSTDSVGIGTTTPTEKLDVVGNIHASGTIQSGNSITIDGATDKITASSGTISFDDENIVTTGKATIGPGHTNTGLNAFVAGANNTANDNYSTVGGGQNNTASGNGSVVPGGHNNVAGGSFSFAAGRRAKANHMGSFVWADATGADFASTSSHQFFVRASGGVRIATNSSSTSGVYLNAGGSSWGTVSDSTLKRNIRRVDTDEILTKLSQLPISQWSYKAQDPSIEHIGPMAQDFHRLFGLGDDDKHINTLDPDGVALAAIQALLDKVEKLEQRITELEAQNKSSARMTVIDAGGPQLAVGISACRTVRNPCMGDLSLGYNSVDTCRIK